MHGDIGQLFEIYATVRVRIEQRLYEFRSIWESNDEQSMRKELFFCLLTPQSKAKVCWGAIAEMDRSDVLLNGIYEEVRRSIGSVRFKNKKAHYLIAARERFAEKGSLRSIIASFETPREARGWFAENIKGMGYKEASHFLRNIGLGSDLAILDRHILRNMSSFGRIGTVPSHLTKKDYLLLEDKVDAWSREVGIPMDHLDMLLWYKEAGDVFK